MLTALEQGVKGGEWFSLIDKVYSAANLLASYAKVAANGGAAGVDHVTVEEFTRRLSGNLEKLAANCETGPTVRRRFARVKIPKPGTQGNAAVGHSDGSRPRRARRDATRPGADLRAGVRRAELRLSPRRGCKDALRRVDELLKQGYRYVVDVDLKSYFDTIPHDKLMARRAQARSPTAACWN